MKSTKLLATLVFASLFSFAQAKVADNVSSSKPPQKESTQKSEPNVAVQLVTPEKEFVDLGIVPEKLSPYILQIVNAYKEEFKEEKGVVAIALEVTAIPPAEGKDCSDYTKCVLVKYFIKGDDFIGDDKLDALGKRLMNIKEVEITNFESKSKAAFIIYIKN